MNEKSIKLIEHTDEEADKKDMKPLPNMTMNYTHPNRFYRAVPNRYQSTGNFSTNFSLLIE